MNNHYKKLREQKTQALETRTQSGEAGNLKESTRHGGNSYGVPVSAQFESGDSTSFLKVETNGMARAVAGEPVKPSSVSAAATTNGIGYPAMKLKKDSKSAQQATPAGEVYQSTKMQHASESEHEAQAPGQAMSRASSILNSN
mgnify:CR=1 FL=1|jgi:hypothetical protein|tara:strand:- start:471 stop:899 length:429 start_codon:yes stop_codon:yes gene_type:complete